MSNLIDVETLPVLDVWGEPRASRPAAGLAVASLTTAEEAEARSAGLS